jgi:hypothetical protein
MTSDNFTHVEIDERAFSIFLIEGIRYFLEQDPPLQEGSIIHYCTRLWQRWQQMTQNEKNPFWDRAVDELRRLRRYQRADIYRSVMREEPPDINDIDRNRRRPTRY